jgi:hypothetical protein
MENNSKNIDHLFKEELGSYTETPPPPVWAALEQRLDNDRKRRVFPFRWFWNITMLLAFVILGAGIAYRLTNSSSSIINTVAATKEENLQSKQEAAPAPTATAAITTTNTTAVTTSTHHSKHRHNDADKKNDIAIAAKENTQKTRNSTPKEEQNPTSTDNAPTVNHELYAYDEEDSKPTASVAGPMQPEQADGYVRSTIRRHHLIASDMTPVAPKEIPIVVTDEAHENSDVITPKADNSAVATLDNKEVPRKTANTSHRSNHKKDRKTVATIDKSAVGVNSVAAKNNTPAVAKKATHAKMHRDSKPTAIVKEYAATNPFAEPVHKKAAVHHFIAAATVADVRKENVNAPINERKKKQQLTATKTTAVASVVKEYANTPDGHVKKEKSLSIAATTPLMHTSGKSGAQGNSTVGRNLNNSKTIAQATEQKAVASAPTTSKPVARNEKIIAAIALSGVNTKANAAKPAVDQLPTTVVKGKKSRNINVAASGNSSKANKEVNTVLPGQKNNEPATAAIKGKTGKHNAQSKKMAVVAAPAIHNHTNGHNKMNAVQQYSKPVTKNTPGNKMVASTKQNSKLDGHLKSTSASAHIAAKKENNKYVSKVANTTAAKVSVGTAGKDETSSVAAKKTGTTIAVTKHTPKAKGSKKNNTAIASSIAPANTIGIHKRISKGTATGKIAAKATPAQKQANVYSSTAARPAKPAAKTIRNTVVPAANQSLADEDEVPATTVAVLASATAKEEPKVAAAPKEPIAATAAKPAADSQAATAAVPATDTPSGKHSRFSYGIKGGYEGGIGSGASNKMVVSPYLEFKLSNKFSLMVQPAIKGAALASHTIGSGTYYDKSNEQQSYTLTDSFLIHLIGGPDLTGRTYSYKETHDSLVKSYKVGGTYVEFELPILLKYAITPKLSVYGGPNLAYSKLMSIKENIFRSTVSATGTSSTATLVGQVAPDPSTGLQPLTFAGSNYANGQAPVYPSQNGSALRIGYMLGFSYEFKKRWMLDALVQQTQTKSYIQGGYNVNSALSLPYFRLTIGYRLSK